MKYKYRYHTDGDFPFKDEIFVFGSNEAGRHGKGAALVARKYYGAEYGNGYGRQGMSFALPTKDENLNPLPLTVIEYFISQFILMASMQPDRKYFMTRVGCGLAGYKDEEIAPLFRDSPTNINFPENWKIYLEA